MDVNSRKWLWAVLLTLAALVCVWLPRAATVLAQGAPSASAKPPVAPSSAKPAGAPAKAPAASASAAPAEPPPQEIPDPGVPTIDAKANAETLFKSGKQLLDEGKYAESCPLLAESLRLDFGLGTLLWLSHCQEQLGQTASAWAGFKEAEEVARKKGETAREQSARERAAALEGKLAKLKIVVAEENTRINAVVKRNGVVVGAAAWGQSLPVDPGTQKLEVEAPGYKTWTEILVVPGGPSESEAKVPALEKLPDADVPKEKGGAIDGRAMRIAGLTIGGAGIAGILIGAGFGIDAIVTYNEALDTCQDENPDLCTSTGVRLQEDASRSALVSTVAFSVGAAALAGGALTFFLAPADEPAPKVGAWVDANGFFLSFGGAL